MLMAKLARVGGNFEGCDLGASATAQIESKCSVI